MNITRYLILLFPFLLISCSYVPKPSYIQYRDKSYLSAKSIPPLKIPPGLSSNAIETHYPIPDRSYPAERIKEVNIQPPGLNS